MIGDLLEMSNTIDELEKKLDAAGLEKLFIANTYQKEIDAKDEQIRLLKAEILTAYEKGLEDEK